MTEENKTDTLDSMEQPEQVEATETAGDVPPEEIVEEAVNGGIGAVSEADPPSEQTQDTHEAEEGDEVAIVRAEAQKNLQGWQRTLAEFQNYRRRVEREQETLRQRIAQETLAKMLPIIDDLERAIVSVPDEIKDNPWFSGFSLIQGKFARLLEESDVTAVDPTGELFDPNLHQAIAMDDSDEIESGHVIETLQKGYVSGETVLRVALVRVAN